MQIRSCEDKLKGKTAHFRLPSASQKRARLSSLITYVDHPSTRTTSRSVEQPSFPTQQAATVLRPKSTRDNDCTSLFEAQSLFTERQQKMIVQAVSHKDAAVLAAILKDHCPSVVKELKKPFVRS